MKRSIIIVILFCVFSTMSFAENIEYRGRVYPGYTKSEKELITRFLEGKRKVDAFTSNPKEVNTIKKFIKDYEKRDFVYGGALPPKDKGPRIYQYEVLVTRYLPYSHVAVTHTETRQRFNPIYLLEDEFANMTESAIIHRYYKQQQEHFFTLGIYGNYVINPGSRAFPMTLDANAGYFYSAHNGFLLETGMSVTNLILGQAKNGKIGASNYLGLGMNISNSPSFGLPIEFVLDFQYINTTNLGFFLRLGTLTPLVYTRFFVDVGGEYSFKKDTVYFKAGVGFQIFI